MARHTLGTLIVATRLLLGSAMAGAQEVTTITEGKDWPKACYNVTSMWKTEACKDYITTVFYAAPAPIFGSGIAGVVLLVGAAGYWVVRRRRGHKHDAS